MVATNQNSNGGGRKDRRLPGKRTNGGADIHKHIYTHVHVHV